VGNDETQMAGNHDSSHDSWLGQRACRTWSWVRPDAFLKSWVLAHVYGGLVIRCVRKLVAAICVAYSASREYQQVAQGPTHGETLLPNVGVDMGIDKDSNAHSTDEDTDAFLYV
jgi:hypothetical protein